MSVLTGDSIDRYRLAVIEQGLKLESLGMRHSRNSVRTAAIQILTGAGRTAPKNRTKLYEVFKAYRASLS